MGMEPSAFHHVPSRRGCVARCYCLTKPCPVLYTYNPPCHAWEGAVVAHSSVLVSVWLLTDLYIATRASFCSSSAFIPCSSLYKAYCTCMLKATGLLIKKEYNKMPSLKHGKGSFGGDLVCAPHKLDSLKVMTPSVATLMVKVGGRH